MHLTRDAAREDVAQLVTLLTESHPDPYAGVGGPLAFHRLARDIFAAIPAEGIAATDLLRLLRPLVASLHDGHTRIGLDMPVRPQSARPWLEWEVVEQELYVAAVYRTEDAVLLGARLRALDAVPFDELCARMGQLQGYDNEYQKLLHLAAALGDPLLLPELLGHSELPATVDVTVVQPRGSAQSVALPLSNAAPGSRLTPPTAIPMPELTAALIGWSFLDGQREVAYLRVDSLLHYREAFEYAAAVGAPASLGQPLEDTARRAHGGDLPADTAARIALVPSATEMLHDLFMAMRDAHTHSLLVDLRFCPGGSSLFALILDYYLHGVEAAIALDEGYQVKRYSPLYLANRQATQREMLEAFFQNGGYDFTEEENWSRLRQTGLTDEERDRRRRELAEYAALMPTFERVFTKRQDEALRTPRIVVLTAARTYSAGFDVAATLMRHRADVVGVPSAQAGNCFIDILPHTLAHSGLRGIISHKWSRMFPDDPARGKVLRPTRELTYDYLAEHNFDPHASVTLALEHLGY
jgi:hypothetical protein